MQIQATSNDIIYARKSHFFDDVPLYVPPNTDTKKKRPKRIPLDRNAPKMVTIKELAKLTGISEYCIRGLYKQGKIAYIKSGTKVFINYNKFLDYLDGIS